MCPWNGVQFADCTLDGVVDDSDLKLVEVNFLKSADCCPQMNPLLAGPGVTPLGVTPGAPAVPLVDLNIDGVISSADWAIVRANQHVSLSGKSLAQAYRLGDFNGDLANNHADFVEFKNLYDAANGVGSFAAMVASVPEPASLAMAGVAATMLVGWGRRSNSTTARR